MAEDDQKHKPHADEYQSLSAGDHRRLGPQLGLFMLHEEAQGMPFWLPNGTTLLRLISEQVQQQLDKRGYQEIRTPSLLNVDLWHQSGHWDKYKQNMYFTNDGNRELALKPMNCPGACMIYSSTRHSYRELPLRLAEFGHVCRAENEGSLHGLLRVRSFTQDDAHVYCTEDQIEAEVSDICEAIDEIYARFGFEDVHVELSTRPEESIGTADQWQRAEAALARALDAQGRDYQVNPGDGAFYGPKIDFHIVDAHGRSWQCGTIQLDFQMPERFDLTYTDADDRPRRPVMIHRALLGSIERFAGILVEHHSGRFPVWLAPIQATILPISDKHVDYALQVERRLRALGIRVDTNLKNETLQKKIAEAESSRYPYMLVVGDREKEHGTVAPRSHENGKLDALSPEQFAELVKRSG